MSHRNFCDFAGHNWECEGTALRLFAGDSEPTACIRVKHQVSMEEGDHSNCPQELLACPEHRDEEFRKMGEFSASDPLPAEGVEDGTGFRDKDGNATIGFCLWCNRDFYSMDEVWEHNDNDMKACPEFQRFLSEERAHDGGTS
jgi:hypothetical protein